MGANTHPSLIGVYVDISTILLSVLFGSIGTGLFVYGNSQHRIAMIVAGVGLMACPYIIGNAVLLGLVGLVLAVGPFYLP